MNVLQRLQRAHIEWSGLAIYRRYRAARSLSSVSTLDREQGIHFDGDEASRTNSSRVQNKSGTNQDIDSELYETLRMVLWKFKAPIQFAFAYGSGVFPQAGYSSKAQKPMVDYIFGVSFAQHFHSLNLSHHWDHYSFLRRLGSGIISHVQTSYGAGVYFNPYVEVNGVMIKYGIVLIDDLCKDLNDWQTLYLAGRMHKPVAILRDNPQVAMAKQRNLYSAVRTALLLLPECFDERHLYTTIAGISYMGDPRMSFGENPRKVENIVTAQLPHFRRLYAPIIERLPNIAFTSGQVPLLDNSADPCASLAQDLDPVKRGNMVRRLPAKFRGHLYYQYRRILGTEATLDGEMPFDDESPYGSAFDRQIAAHKNLPAEVAKSIKATVSWPSTSQSIKGILTAGPFKSWSYVGEKLAKARKKKDEGEQ